MDKQWGRIRTTRQVITDSWELTSTLRGIQIQKNGRNILFCTSFEEAWTFVQNRATSGDHIKINVDGVLS